MDCVLGDGTCHRDVASTGESMSAVQARQEEARRKRRRKRRSGSSVVSSCFQGKFGAEERVRENVCRCPRRDSRDHPDPIARWECERVRETEWRREGGCGSRVERPFSIFRCEAGSPRAHAPPLSPSILHRWLAVLLRRYVWPWTSWECSRNTRDGDNRSRRRLGILRAACL